MKSVMVNQFKQLPDVSFGRNTFNRSFGTLTTLDAGKLYPVMFDEIIPGDTYNLSASFFGRINTLIVPSYINLYLDFHLWYVPNRLVWDNWSFFFGESYNNYGKQTPDPDTLLNPICEAPSGGFPRYGLADYFTVPPEVDNVFVDAKYFRAYNLIWNTFYRSETLQEPVTVPTDDGPDDYSLYNILPRGKRFDYFTSCLPEPQRGESVYLPIGGSAPVTLSDDGQFKLYHTGDLNGMPVVMGASQSTNKPMYVSTTYNSQDNLYYSSGIKGEVDLSQSTSLTIQAFRNLVALNQFLERENRYGTRLQELIYGHFGVTAPDYRLQYPEYLGGTTIRLNVSSVPQTSSTETSATPQGNLSAYGVVADSSQICNRSFVEHGVIIGLVSIRGDLRYQQGIDRMLTRRKKLDFMFPEFAGISDQEVYNREIYADGTDADDEIFGYQERYGEYRYHNSYITGKMRSSDPQTLDIWHDAQDFENRPVLNDEFIEENPPLARLIAVPTEPQFTLDCLFTLNHTRELPLFGIPGLERL